MRDTAIQELVSYLVLDTENATLAGPSLGTETPTEQQTFAVSVMAVWPFPQLFFAARSVDCSWAVGAVTILEASGIKYEWGVNFLLPT